ncbi:MAG: DUF1533 domain-containing protein [Oscillospiraceae bacterium]|jgi:hypothetical protein|nr:DUF1533 domain-containing protein [Oscillospiraceae bacterium]
MKRVCSILLAITLLIAGNIFRLPSASAKTLTSAKGDNIFVYTTGSDNSSVLLKVIKLDELKSLAHGQKNGQNYYISSTDNYPTTQYCEARGVTVPELLAYVKSVTSVHGADSLTFSGSDTLRLMATDSYGNYNRAWTYDALYGTPRYYFEGLFKAWKPAWEIAGAASSDAAITSAEYNSVYRDSDPFYKEKLAVFNGGARTEPILATESFSGRTTADALVASTEVGIADYITRNGGTAAGSLKDRLTDSTALRLALPMTEEDLFLSNRTAFDNFKWIYNIQFSGSVAVSPLGKVAEPVTAASVSGDTLTFTVSCADAGAGIYYGFDGAPQTPYTEPIRVDVSGRDLAREPVDFYVTAVKEGFSDAGIIGVKYPGLAPTFKTLYSAMVNTDVVFAPAESVSGSDWNAWTSAIQFITIKRPKSDGYVKIEPTSYAFGASDFRIIGAEFTELGAYSVVFHAAGYADKSAGFTVKQIAPEISLAAPAEIGKPLKFAFADESYIVGAALYVTLPNGEQTMLPSSKINACVPELPGDYKLSFVNGKFEPTAIELIVTVAEDSAYVTRGEFVEKHFPDGVLRGYGGGNMGLDDPITNGQIAIVLARANGIGDTGAWIWAAERGLFAAETVAGAYAAEPEIIQILEKYNADRTT